MTWLHGRVPARLLAACAVLLGTASAGVLAGAPATYAAPERALPCHMSGSAGTACRTLLYRRSGRPVVP